MKKILIIQSFLSIMQGCSCTFVSKEIKQKFAVCYTGKHTDIESYIEINGYYTMLNEEWNHISNMIFFKDGTFTWHFHIKPELYKSDSCINLVHANTVNNKNKSFFTPGIYDGLYWIQGDTIKAQYLNKAALLSPFVFSERWFKIIDRQTLQFIYSKPLFDSQVYAVKTNEEWKRNNKYSFAKFYCTDSVPFLDCWLKKKKWFWCNKEDWKNYKKKLKLINQNNL